MGCLYSLTLIDSYGRTTKRVYEAVELALKADQVTALESFIDQYQAVTDLGLVRADIIYTAAGTPFAVTAGANRDVGATFSGLKEGGNGAKVSLKLPGIKAEFVREDGSIDLEDPDIEDWIELFVEDTPHSLLLSDGDTVESWLRGTLDS